ncbi:unnamed protein product [Prorocentrum cordatum]|uniref:Uncharacterized protein n=1 Tax=Prorocentrum cordatum TaxID=2364126 RepID=A0ABN9XIX0_9DINO|nr:unnamed protein product [Polarella glacialis]
MLQCASHNWWTCAPARNRKQFAKLSPASLCMHEEEEEEGGGGGRTRRRRTRRWWWYSASGRVSNESLIARDRCAHSEGRPPRET